MSVKPSALVQALLRGDAYPHRPKSVELVRTHISYVFLTGDYVYKVKKPVDFGFLDFTTLEKRRYFCQQEVELNRRLAPDVYLGVEEVREQNGRIAIDGKGRTIDYAVKMRQLPRDRQMNELLRRGLVTPAMVRDIARTLATFHQRAEASPAIVEFGSVEAVGRNVIENFEQTEKYIGRSVSRDAWQETQDYARSFMSANRAVFERRVAEGRIRDCHGDLHSAQIFLVDKTYIVDCIEFNQRFRYIDTANDLAFLAMDLDFHGQRRLTKALIDAYVAASGDQGLRVLLDFYKCYRACVRAKVNSFQLDDQDVSGESKERLAAAARDYFDLAHAYAVGRSRPFLFITSGLVGTGKSTVAEGLAKAAGAVVISSDVVRKTLAGIPLAERRLEGYQTGLYDPAFSRRVYDELAVQGRKLLEQGKSVVLDASFGKAEERRRTVALAEATRAQLYVLECLCAEPEVKTRLEARLRAGTSPSDGRWEVYEQQRKSFEPILEVPAARHFIVDTTASSQQAVHELLETLESILVPQDTSRSQA
ncbi:MAG: AAA family ATPase [Chloroflexi bacterium]|nr:AAA family ATPase [Chloroflexota bacterium]